MSVAVAYEADTIVLDLNDEQPEDMTMHVYVDGEWHRRFQNRSVTSCGTPYHSQFGALRRESLDGPLCRTCFTPFELADSERLKEEAERGTK